MHAWLQRKFYFRDNIYTLCTSRKHSILLIFMTRYEHRMCKITLNIKHDSKYAIISSERYIFPSKNTGRLTLQFHIS